MQTSSYWELLTRGGSDGVQRPTDLTAGGAIDAIAGASVGFGFASGATGPTWSS
jgi:hypothetical protein